MAIKRAAPTPRQRGGNALVFPSPPSPSQIKAGGHFGVRGRGRCTPGVLLWPVAADTMETNCQRSSAALHHAVRDMRPEGQRRGCQQTRRGGPAITAG